MKKILIFTLSLAWLLTPSLSCSAMKVGDPRNFPSARNARGDLFGENLGDQIAFNWLPEDGATEYIVYRSLSPAGPWEVLDRIDDRHARTSGGKVDVTPDARLMDLCYKVEAIDATGNVIRVYEPICIPKAVQ